LDKKSTKDKRIQVSLGVTHTIAYNSCNEVYHDGNVRLLMREDIPVSKRIRASMVNTDKEYMAGLKYIAGKYWISHTL
jgi:hypothetical protein